MQLLDCLLVLFVSPAVVGFVIGDHPGDVLYGLVEPWELRLHGGRRTRLAVTASLAHTSPQGSSPTSTVR